MWPTTEDPRIVFVTLRLTVSEAADLDAHAAAAGVTRSTAVRAAVEQAVAHGKQHSNNQPAQPTSGAAAVSAEE